MFDDEVTAPTLVALADSADEGLLPVPSAVPRLVASVWPRPYDSPEAFLPAARPLLEHQRMHPGDTFCVIADYQLLLSGGGRADHAEAVYDTAAALLALGVDPRNTSLCRESDVAALPEVYWLLSCALWLPPPGVEASMALPRGADDAARECALLLAALAFGLGASSLVLALTPHEPGAALSSLLREVGLRLNPGQTPFEVLREGAADGRASFGAAPDLGSAGARYDAIRHNTPFLRDVLNEGALAAATVSTTAIARLREYLHLGDGGMGHP
ncbi:MAG: hypothetical protein ACJ74Q_05895 [Pyrinomonadaceae bacterium]